MCKILQNTSWKHNRKKWVLQWRYWKCSNLFSSQHSLPSWFKAFVDWHTFLQHAKYVKQAGTDWTTIWQGVSRNWGNLRLYRQRGTASSTEDQHWSSVLLTKHTVINVTRDTKPQRLSCSACVFLFRCLHLPLSVFRHCGDGQTCWTCQSDMFFYSQTCTVCTILSGYMWSLHQIVLTSDKVHELCNEAQLFHLYS